MASINKKILCVDLDGTFLKTDMLYESFFYCFFRNPFILLLSLYWLITVGGGKTLLKSKLSEHFSFSANKIPVNKEIVSLIKKKKDEGYKVYLVSASIEQIVKKFFLAYQELFDGYYASNKDTQNLSSKNKALFLNNLFGKKQYEYVGNSNDDIEVWNNASYGYCFTDKYNILSKINNRYESIAKEKYFSLLKQIVKQLRCHQWTKNVLFLIPALACAHVLPFKNYILLLLGILSFSLIASSVYIINDFIDLDNDRAHEIKKNRPIASGNLSLIYAFFLLVINLIVGIVISLSISHEYLFYVLCYLVINILYSIKFKSILILDCIILAILYTYRIFLGCVITDLVVSIWLLSFSFFLFLSLAFVKRYTELFKYQNKVKQIKGRGYLVSDMSLIQIMSVSSGFLATLILDLFLNDENIQVNFHNIWLAYACLPVFLYWLCHIYIISSRGKMSDDPVSFALKDRLSICLGIVFCLFFWAGIYS